MQRPAIINTPIITPEEVAKRLGLSKKRQKYIQEIVQNSIQPKRPANNRTEKSKDTPSKPRPTAANEAA